mmetsp:Transcript_15133/g.30539  ORF Transcript_15133/g.30539 Transcript_15133/m.30539 type:complete len:281 (+) Transcript_15133:334-1176(+)
MSTQIDTRQPIRSRLFLSKLRRVQQWSDKSLQVIHHKHSAAHPTVTEGGTTVETSEATLSHYSLRRLEERTVLLTFDITLHAGLDGISRVGQVAREQPAKQRGGNTRLVVRIEGIGEGFAEITSNDGGDREVTAAPQSFADGGADESSSYGGGVGNGGGGGEQAAALALLLDHYKLQRRPGRGRYDASGDAAQHFLIRQKLLPTGFILDGLLERATHGELDHGTRAHVDAIRADAAIQLARVKGEGLTLLQHVFPVIETLQTEHLDDSHRHTDSGIFQFV